MSVRLTGQGCPPLTLDDIGPGSPGSSLLSRPMTHHVGRALRPVGSVSSVPGLGLPQPYGRVFGLLVSLAFAGWSAQRTSVFLPLPALGGCSPVDTLTPDPGDGVRRWGLREVIWSGGLPRSLRPRIQWAATPSDAGSPCAEWSPGLQTAGDKCLLSVGFSLRNCFSSEPTRKRHTRVCGAGIWASGALRTRGPGQRPAELECCQRWCLPSIPGHRPLPRSVLLHGATGLSRQCDRCGAIVTGPFSEGRKPGLAPIALGRTGACAHL